MKRDYGPPVKGAATVHASLGTAKSLIQRLRKRYVSTLREKGCRTVSDPDEIDKEFYAFCGALTQPKGD